MNVSSKSELSRFQAFSNLLETHTSKTLNWDTVLRGDQPKGEYDIKINWIKSFFIIVKARFYELVTILWERIIRENTALLAVHGVALRSSFLVVESWFFFSIDALL